MTERKHADDHKHSHKPATTATVQTDPPPDVLGAEALFTQLQRTLGAHAPSVTLVTYFKSTIAAEAATKDGEQIASDLVIADAMGCMPAIVPVINEGGLPGYGPKECHYTLGLLIQLSSAFTTQLAAEREQAGASGTKHDAKRTAQHARAKLHHILASSLPAHSPESQALAKANAHGSKSVAEVNAGVTAMTGAARSMLTSAPSTPGMAEALEDKGLTPALVNEVTAQSTHLAASEGDHTVTRADHGAAYAALNELDGRVMHELRLLRHAAMLARAEGRAVPDVRLDRIDRVHPHHHRAAPVASTAATAATPAAGK